MESSNLELLISPQGRCPDLIKILFLVLFTLFSVMGGGCLTQHVPEGTTLEGVDISGLTLEEYEEARDEIIQEWNDREIELRTENQERLVKVRDLGIVFFFENDRIMEEAGNYLLEWEYCPEAIENKIGEIFTIVLEEPENAELVVDSEPRIIEHQEGEGISLEESVQIIGENAKEDVIELPLETLLPEVTTQDIKDLGIKERIASFTTEFDTGRVNRSNNIALAGSSVDHIMLKPGEVFSFNERAGPYSSDRGFKSAPVFRQGEVITGVGGGVCQVSSTLYNAALLSGLEIVERYSHSLPVWYVPLARDASVSFGGGDLKFKNSLNSHVYIRMTTNKERGIITAYFFGTKEKDVEVGSRIERRISPDLEEREVEGIKEKKVIEEGKDGFEAISWRIINGERENLSRDHYQPVKRVVEIPPEKEKPEEEEDKEKDKEEKEEDRPEEEEPEGEEPEGEEIQA